MKLPVTPSTAALSKSQKSKTKKKTVDQKASKLDSPVKNTSTVAISPEVLYMPFACNCTTGNDWIESLEQNDAHTNCT